MKRTRVKICGITNTDDALAAVRSGCDAIGLNFYQASPRSVSLEQAQLICKILPPFVTVVGLFVDADKGLVNEVIENVDVDLLQFHGNESEIYCSSFELPYIKAISVGGDAIGEEALAELVLDNYQSARMILLDTFNKKLKGGTGEVFDWSLVSEEIASKIILAGGLNSDNVEQAISLVKPYAVDVSGGVELAQKGVKDNARIEAFMSAVAKADLNQA